MAPVDRRSILPFLVVAYPATIVVLEARPQCRPDCPAFGLHDVGVTLAVVVGSLLVAAVVTAVAERSRFGGRPLVRRSLSPSRRTALALVAVYAGYLAFLLADAAGVGNGPWRLVPLLVSFLLFAPVWALYVGTFVLAVALPVAGVGPSATLTTVVRAVVVGVGLGGSAVWQFALAELLLGRGDCTESES